MNKRTITITLKDTDMTYGKDIQGVSCEIAIKGPEPEFDPVTKQCTNDSPALLLMDRMMHAAKDFSEAMLSDKQAQEQCDQAGGFGA